MSRASERQLSLFKSRRQRGVAPPSPLEFSMQCAVADTLRRWASPNWIWNHIPGGEARPAAFVKGKRVSFAGERLKRAGFQPGWSDFLLIPPREHPVPRPHFLELKRLGEGLSEQQEELALWCKLNGCPFEMVDTYEDAVRVLKTWGAVQSRVHVQ